MSEVGIAVLLLLGFCMFLSARVSELQRRVERLSSQVGRLMVWHDKTVKPRSAKPIPMPPRGDPGRDFMP